jgi:hypothetical protein
MSDDKGEYLIRGVRSSYGMMSPLLSASKPGFFAATEFAHGDYSPIVTDTTLDLVMIPIVTVPVGVTHHGRVAQAGDHPCSNYGYGTSDCQRFALTMPATGSLEITISGSAGVFRHDVDIVGPDGAIVVYDPRWSNPTRHTLMVHSGSTYEIRVIGFTGEDFDLSTTLRTNQP